MHFFQLSKMLNIQYDMGIHIYVYILFSISQTAKSPMD